MLGDIETSGLGAGRDRSVLALIVLRSAVVVAFLAIIVAFWLLQVAQHEKYRLLAENNHQRTISLSAPRGSVFDRDGRVLIQNRSSLNISVAREQVDDLDATLNLLGEVAGVPLSTLRSVAQRHRRAPVYRPLVLIRDASLAQVGTSKYRTRSLPDH